MKSIPLLLAFVAFAPFAKAQAPPPSGADCAIDGSVVNSITAEPIVRAHVTLQLQDAVSTSTDNSGGWRFANIPCGQGPLTVTRPGFLTQARRTVALESGSPVHDMKIELVPQSVFYGKVVDDQGDPVQGMEVVVLVSRVVDGKFSFQHGGAGVTNDLGEYRVAGLVRGKYIVCSSGVDGLLRQESAMVAPVCYPGPVDGGIANAMDVPAGRETRVDLTLTPVPAVHVRGTVTGLPDARGAVNLVSRGAAPGIGVNLNGTARNGKFDLRAAAGSYVLMTDYFDNGKHLFARVPVDVGSTDIDNLAVAVDSGFTLTGSVRIDSQSQQPAKPARFGLSLRSADPTIPSGQLKWELEGTAFSFNDMMPGNYRLEVFPPSPYYVKSATLAGADILNADVPITQGVGPIEIVLGDDGGTIEADIVDADGKPVDGSVLAMRNGRAISPLSASQTSHYKVTDLAPGDYRVYAWDDVSQVAYADDEWMKLYAGPTVDVTVSAGQTSKVKLTCRTVPR